MLKTISGSPKNLIFLYLASLFVQTGTAMTVSYVPLYAQDLGAGLTMVGLIATAASLGSMAVNLPGGFLTERYPALRIFTGCFLLMGAAALVRSLFPTVGTLLAAGLALGAGQSLWILSRLTYIRKDVPLQVRGRVLSGFGGILRTARVIGPLIGSALIAAAGYSSLFLGEALLLFAALLLLITGFRLPGSFHQPRGSKESFTAVRDHIAGNRRNITSAMVGIFALTLLRAARLLIVPLWAAHIGVGIAQLGLVISISALLEIALVIPAGFSVDKLGRKPTLFITIFISAVGLSLIPLAGSFTGLLAVSLLISLGNGIGSGINMIFSTDLAPSTSTGLFIGIWRIITETGTAVGPFVVGLISDEIALSAAPPLIAAAGLAGGVVMLIFFREDLLADTLSADHS